MEIGINGKVLAVIIRIIIVKENMGGFVKMEVEKEKYDNKNEQE